MKHDKEVGFLRSVARLEDDAGRVILRAVVDFHDGNGPEVTLETIQQGEPVKLVLCNVRK